MRITRSGLRRIIAEESARILAETKKRDQSPRDRLAAYLDSVGADSAAIMRAVGRAVDRAHEEGSEVTSEDITFNLSDEVLDAIPEDDSDRWHSMLDAVLADEIDPDAFADAEADRRDVEDTERSLDREEGLSDYGDEGEDDYDDGGDWYLEEGDDDALDEYGDPNDSDPDGGYMGFMASDDEMNYLRGGGSYSNSPYADNDVPDNAYTRGRAKGFGREPRVRGDDIDSGYDDADDMGDNLAESRWAKLAGILKD